MESNYDILGIGEGSTQKDIRDAFRRLALQVHSDRGGESAKFIRIKQAYEDLKVGKKYPDTPLEKLRSSRVFSGDVDEEVRRRNEIIGREVSAEMREAQEWAGALRRASITGTRMFGSKTLGEMEMEVKANGVLHMKGNYMAGSITYDGPVMMQGSISSPSWTQEFGTNIVVRRGRFQDGQPTGEQVPHRERGVGHGRGGQRHSRETSSGGSTGWTTPTAGWACTPCGSTAPGCARPGAA